MTVSLDITAIIVALVILLGLILLFKFAKLVGRVIGIVTLFILILVYIVPNLPALLG